MLGFEKGDRVQRGDKREVVGKLGFLRVVNPLNSEKREREREREINLGHKFTRTGGVMLM